MRPHTSTRAFTLIEMMIVIGIIGLLISISMTALISVRKQGYKVGEKNNIRQLGNAWLKYSQIHREKIAPAWLSPNTQSKWETELVYPDGTTISPAPTYGSDQPNVAGPWTWRLLPYMENDLRLIRGNRDSPPINQWDVVTEDMKLDIAQTPEFGLNGYFLGGVWDRWYGDIRKNHPRFVRVEDVDERKVNLVSKSLSLMKHPSRVIGFISNASGEPGRIGTPLDSDPGHWLATPHRLGDEIQWRLNASLDLEMAEGQSAPIGRHGGPTVTWHPDGHVDGFTMSELLDQRLWIDRANDEIGDRGSGYLYTE